MSSSEIPRRNTKILLLENIHASAEQLLVGEGFQVERTTSALKKADLIAKLKGVHALGIRSKSHIDADVLASASELLTVGCYCIGTNQVDLRAANKRGVPVFNAPFSNTRSVAEMIIAEIIMLARQIGDRSREVHEGKWRKVALGSYEVRGKILGIVGYGHIGRQVGVMAESMGMRVLFFDVKTSLPMGNNQPATSLTQLLEQSDFVTLHVPETPQTKNLIGREELSRMRPGSYLLNASRGTVVVIDALAEALKSKHLAGCAIDVYPEEPEANGDDFSTPLRNLPNVILTPHVGGSTVEAQESIGREVATSFLKFLTAGTTTGAVNFPQIELPRADGSRRILNVHRNVPGVLRDINKIVSDRDANISAQMLSTDADIGYMVMDVETAGAEEVADAIGALPTSLRTRTIG